MLTSKKPYGIALIGVLLFLYVAIRCVTVDITHDEAYTFKVMKHFWYAEAFCTANTHWLNSIAVKAAQFFGFEKNWQIRWLSLVSAALFFFAAYRWIKSLQRLPLRVFAACLLMLNPFVTDFLGLARGYASGIMLETVALLLLFDSFDESRSYKGRIGLLCAALSAFANYSFVYFFLAYCLFYFPRQYYKRGTGWLKNKWLYGDVLLSITALLLIGRALLFIIRCSNDIVGAGTSGFTDVTNYCIGDLLYTQVNISENRPLA